MRPYYGRDGRPVHKLQQSLAADTERIKSARVVVNAIVEGQQAKERVMSLMGKLNALTERAQDFNKTTETKLDELGTKIDDTERKRDEALAKHHAHYDKLAASIDESAAVIDRLSNSPLGEGS